MEICSWHHHYPAGLSPSASYPREALWWLLADSARRFGTKTALVSHGRSWTYQESWDIALGVAAKIRSELRFGEPEPPRVVLVLPNCAPFLFCYHGALAAGAVVSAASIALTAEELAAQLKDAAPQLVITQSKRSAFVRDALKTVRVNGSVWAIEDMAFAPTSAAFEPIPVADPTQAVAVLQYTSGTTGSAKGAMMSHANLLSNALQNARWFGWGQDEINLSILPLYHTWGMCCCMNSTLAVGGTLVLHDNEQPFDPRAVFDAVRGHRATVLYGSATMFHRLLDVSAEHNACLATLRHIKAGAMLTQGNLKARWDERFPHAPLQQGYGLTEASPESHNNPPQRFKKGTVGVPIQDTECRIVDADDPAKMLPPGRPGEVLLRGPQVMLGYWHKPDATQAAFHDGWLKTGDIGVMDEDGYLTIVDRKKDLIKFRGYSVSANNVEECLLRHPAVKEVVVVGKRDEREGEIPTACIVLGPGMDASAEVGLRAHCECSLSPYERPREYVFIDVIPRNHVGKPLRRELREQINRGG
ncbi:MAG: AMP-binding protein [Planctomycetes bacterium]|nr:AMP-binding protein [Planctomycetota bacterium]NUQ34985.1 AMP-binding protein [Planctomycetaceae bacterium]